MLPDDAASMYEAPCLSGAPLMCFPSGESVVTFLILLDWKNIANMVWSGKSFDAGALQINPWMPYGLHSSLNLFPINVYWILGRANMCVTRLGKQKAGESSLWQSVIIMICPFSSPRCMIDEPHSLSNTSKQENMQTVPLWARQFPAHLPVPGPTRRNVSLKEQLKSNDCKLHHDSSADRLFPVKLGIRLPVMEKSTDSGRPAVEDMEVSFSKRSRLSYGGFQRSGDITCFLCEATLRLQAAKDLSSAAASCVGVSSTKHTALWSFFLRLEPSMQK